MNPTPPEREAERFRTTFEQAPVGISHHAPDGQWLLANARFAEMLGYRPDELIAQSFQEITHPENLAADLAEPDRRALQLIRYSADSLEELTRAVRRLVRDDPESPPEPVELTAWWRNVQPLLEATLPPGMLLAADIRAAPPILVNPGRLTRAVLNLVVNAAEALMAAGCDGGHIAVEGGPDPLGAVFVRVQDDGPGIAPAVQRRIFEPFFSTSARDFSSRLGLPMVKAFAIAAGGSVSIVTAANEGTAITLRLPIAGVDTAA